MYKIVFTGGGTAGHVTPNLALIDALQKEHWQIVYIGSKDGVEKKMIQAADIPYYAIRCGKLRRYFSMQNFLDPFNMVVGILQAYFLLRDIKPNVVFSKGGFVAFPVVVAAWLNRIPTMAHESDMSPGLANRLSFPFVDTICLTFAAASRHFKRQDKIKVTGTPIRSDLLHGDRNRGLTLCGFSDDKPFLLIMGGSQGSTVMNTCVRQALPDLLQSFQIIHLCGRGNIDNSLVAEAGYVQFEYANRELADLFALSDIVISRAGANSLYEILVLEKPHVLIPLSRKASRGDQIENAAYFKEQGISLVIDEACLTPDVLKDAVHKGYAKRSEIKKTICSLNIQSATATIVELIKAAI